jgi:hypothetical protein
VAGETGVPLGPFCLAGNVRLHLCRVRQKIVPALPPLPWRKSRKRDPIVVALFGKFFCAVALR